MFAGKFVFAFLNGQQTYFLQIRTSSWAMSDLLIHKAFKQMGSASERKKKSLNPFQLPKGSISTCQIQTLHVLSWLQQLTAKEPLGLTLGRLAMQPVERW